MSSAEHLIENAIYALYDGKQCEEVLEILQRSPNKEMLEETGMKADDVFAMAIHVVYALYDGTFPDFP